MYFLIIGLHNFTGKIPILIHFLSLSLIIVYTVTEVNTLLPIVQNKIKSLKCNVKTVEVML